MNIKSIHRPEGGGGLLVKRKKKEAKSKKKKQTDEWSDDVAKNMLNDKTVEKNDDETMVKFPPLKQVRADDFEGVDLDKLERVNMQVFFTFYLTHCVH